MSYGRRCKNAEVIRQFGFKDERPMTKCLLASTIVICSILGCTSESHQANVPVSSASVAKTASVATPVSLPVTRAVEVQPPEPFLLHLPGIGGRRAIDLNMTRGLVLGGYSGSLRIYDWTENDEGLTSLWGVDRHRRQAKLIADQLTEAYDLNTRRPLYLTAHSGGTGLAVWALEGSPERVKVKNLLLLEPALSPTYDLTKALRHVSGKAYVFSSTSDPVVGLGCRMMGTIDGPKVNAAGNIGFERPAAADARQYEKVVSLLYNPAWVKWHDYGDHVGPMSRSFATNVLAPLMFHDVFPSNDATTKPVGR